MEILHSACQANCCHFEVKNNCNYCFKSKTYYMYMYSTADWQIQTKHLHVGFYMYMIYLKYMCPCNVKLASYLFLEALREAKHNNYRILSTIRLVIRKNGENIKQMKQEYTISLSLIYIRYTWEQKPVIRPIGWKEITFAIWITMS